MEGSSIDESTTTDSTSTTLPTTSTVILSLSSTPIKSPLHQSLRRLGSGASSVILDLENNNIEAESRKLPSSRFKGVVPQPNGRWGAQIYEKHQRVWLGTFNEEEEAGRAYDVAAQRFRGRDAITNFKLLTEATEEDEIESAFLNRHSKAEIVDMLRKHTYNDELNQSKKHQINYHLGSYVVSSQKGASGFGDFSANGGEICKAKEQLFEKTVTPSDVGKLNRLVIPKQHAEKHFPLQSESCSKGVLLNFEDTGRRVWRFRYSYWNSSQSYVLTKGWSRFVKEKCLKAGDVVCFQRSTGSPDNNNQQLYIDFKARSTGGATIEPVNIPVQMVRLFGVNIVKSTVCGAVDNISSSSSKRIREVEMLSLEICSKKQRVIGAS